MNLLVDGDFRVGSPGDEVAQGWHIKPDNNTFSYKLEEITDTQTGKSTIAQRVTGEGRGDGYIWTRFPIKENTRYVLEARVKTIGETSAQLWLFFINEEGKNMFRVGSDHILGDSDWSNIYMEYVSPPGSAEGMLFAISFTVGEEASALWDFIQVTEMNGCETKEQAHELELMIGEKKDTPIIPKPKHINHRSGSSWHLTPETVIYLVDQGSQGQVFVSQYLQNYINENYQLLIPIKPFCSDVAAAPSIVLSDHHFTGFIKPPEQSEGYVIHVEEHTAYIIGNDDRGAFYGVQSFIQLLEKSFYSKTGITPIKIEDWPDLEWRGMHICMDFYSTPFSIDLVKNMIARYKFNHLVIECSMLKWDSHPEIWLQEASTKKELAKVIQTAKDHMLEVIPLVQSLGHCRWLFNHGQNMDICEDPEHPWCYNPLNERSYKVIFDIMDEAIDLFRPSYMHIGHDEVRMVGRFPYSEAGKKMGFGKLFVLDTNWIAKFLRNHGIKTMMWADVVQEASFLPYLQELDPDIWMVDWQYHPFRSYEGIDRLTKAGFPAIGSSWYNPNNIHTFAKYIYKQKGKGLLQTTWTGHFGSALALNKEMHQYVAHLYAAETFWNVQGYPSLEKLPYDPKMIVTRALKASAMNKELPNWGTSW